MVFVVFFKLHFKTIWFIFETCILIYIVFCLLCFAFYVVHETTVQQKVREYFKSINLPFHYEIKLDLKGAGAHHPKIP